MTVTFTELTFQTFEAYDASCVNVISWQGISVNTFGLGIRKIISLFGTKLRNDQRTLHYAVTSPITSLTCYKWLLAQREPK